jgi:hypothetical protein
MSSSLIEILSPRISLVISQGFSLYERKYGAFKTDKQRRDLEKVVSRLFPLIIERIDNSDPVTIDPFKIIILEGLFAVGIGQPYPVELFESIIETIETYTQELPGVYTEFLRSIKEYGRLIKESVLDVNFFSASSVFDILQTPEQYQYSEDQFYFSPKQVDENERKLYTLFPKERYWETFQQLSDTTSYSPLSYNRVAGRIGKPSYRLAINYDDLIIYNGELYKLNSDVSSPSRETFEPDQWTKYTSKRLNSLSRFKEVFNKNIEQYYVGFLENGFDINSISSDSKVEEYSAPVIVNEDLLSTTFGGEGKALFSSIKRLKALGDYFGSYEGSIVGGIEYITKYSEYLLACAYGRNEGNVFEIINNQTSFGRFDILFVSKITINRIPGLNFLKGFLKLKSFVHGQQIGDGIDISKQTINYNPVYTQFKDGVKDRYVPKIKKDSYTLTPELDLLLSSLETLYNRYLYLGDLVKATLNSLDDRGKLKGYDGLGSIEPQLRELQRVFPPSPYINDLGPGVAPGLSGSIKFLLESYSSLSRTFIYSQLPGKSLEFILKVSSAISEQINSIIDTIKKLSISSFSYIPNISNKSFQSQNTSIISFLRSLGFKDSEINNLLQANSFAELVSSFAPLSDSDDLKSFLKGFELSQLIYEIGGEDGINAYLSFLYSTSDIDGLLNILSIAQKDKSKATYVQISQYPKLVGLLIGLTYAIDPNQLIKFTKILGQNNLTLLESITYLFESGQDSIIKSRDNIELLQPIINQIIQGNYSDPFSSPDLTYPQTNKTVPIALKQWTQLLGDNLGNIPSVDFISGLYDRSVGLTAKELLQILGTTSPTTPLGQMLDGFNGGNFTRFIQYANITGLGIKLGYYKNSAQLDNFKLEPTSSSLGILPLLEGLESAVEAINIINIIFESNLDYTYASDKNERLQTLLNAQNKTYESLSDTVSQLLSSVDEENLIAIKGFAGNAPILESPGVGNSRLPNRIPATNSITAEQYRVLFTQGAVSTSTIENLSKDATSSLINNFIKFAEGNKLINLVNQTDESSSLVNASNKTTSWQPASAYETPPTNIKVPSLEYKVPGIYLDEEGMADKITSNVLGVSYKQQSTFETPIPQELLGQFDPVTSCQRFGGNDCQELYEGVAERCVTELNKSLFPEEYKSIPGVSSTTISIDRPLGSFVDFKPSKSFVSTSQYNTPSTYVSLLGQKLEGFGNKGEPITSQIFSTPLVFDSGGGELSEYNNTEFGVIEGIRARLEKNTEFNCAMFDSPFEYQICMNIIKCKKFALPFEGKYSLDFCPKTLAGGRLK